MSNHSHLLAGVKKLVRSQRRAQPYDRFTKAELWERIERAEHQLAAIEVKAASVAHNADHYAIAATGDNRAAFMQLRSAAYGVRDAAAVS